MSTGVPSPLAHHRKNLRPTELGRPPYLMRRELAGVASADVGWSAISADSSFDKRVAKE